MPLLAGQRVVVKYTTDPALWHERIVLLPLQGSAYLLLTPERSISEEDLRVPCVGNLGAVRVLKEDGSFLGRGTADLFRFADSDEGEISDDELQQWLDEATTLTVDRVGDEEGSGNLLSRAIGDSHGTGGPGAQSLVPAGGNLIGHALGVSAPPSSQLKWTLIEPVGSFVSGSVVPNDWDVIRLGNKGIATAPSGEHVFIHQIARASADAKSSGDPVFDARIFALENERNDTRVMPLKRDALGKRHLDFKESCDKSAPFKPEDFPLLGPLSCLWLMKYMLGNGGSPSSFHQRFMSDTRLDYSAGGMAEHMTLCKALEMFSVYDQLDLTKSAGCELIARRIQIIHEKWRHKLPNLNPSGSSAGGDDDSYLLLGTSETRGNIGVCPELSIWLGSELSKQALADKERRKAREERALQVKKT